MKKLLIVIMLITSFLNGDAQNINLLGKSYQEVLDYQSNVGGVLMPHPIKLKNYVELIYNATTPTSNGLASYTYMFEKELCTSIVISYNGNFNRDKKPILNRKYQRYNSINWVQISKRIQIMVIDFPEKSFYSLVYSRI